MGDTADILGVRKEAKSMVPESALGGGQSSSGRKKTASVKPPHVSREVFALLGLDKRAGTPGPEGDGAATAALLPSMMPPARGFRDRRGPGTKWEWAPYDNSARAGDGGQKFHRWNKVGIEFMDYPYARFNVKLDKLTYSDEEHASLLAPLDAGPGNPPWTRADDDTLAVLAHRYDLRWPVIYDRWTRTPPRPVHHLQHRYYSMAQTLLANRRRLYAAEMASAAGGGVDASAAVAAKVEDRARGLGVSLSQDYSQGQEEVRADPPRARFAARTPRRWGAEWRTRICLCAPLARPDSPTTPADAISLSSPTGVYFHVRAVFRRGGAECCLTCHAAAAALLGCPTGAAGAVGGGVDERAARRQDG